MLFTACSKRLASSTQYWRRDLYGRSPFIILIAIVTQYIGIIGCFQQKKQLCNYCVRFFNTRTTKPIKRTSFKTSFKIYSNLWYDEFIYLFFISEIFHDFYYNIWRIKLL